SAKFRGRPRRNADFLLKECIQCFEPQHLAVKGGTEVSRNGMRNVLERWRSTELLFHRCHRLVHNPAGNNQVEEAEINIHIQREAVRSHAARDVYSNRGNLSLLILIVQLIPFRWTGEDARLSTDSHRLGSGPHAREPGHPFSGNLEIGARPNQHFFEAPHILDYAQRLALAAFRRKSSQIEYRISD